MVTLVELLNVLLPVAYVLLTAGYAATFTNESPRLARALRPTLHVTVGLHALYIVMRTIAFDHLPMASLFESLTVVGFAVALVYWIIERIVKTQSTGMFVLGLVAVFQVISSAFIGHTGDINPVFRNALFAIHAGAAVLGYAAFGVAAVYGVLYVMLHRELKTNSFGVVFSRMPALTTLGSMHEVGVIVGLSALTLAILHGLLWLPQVYGWEITDPMVVRTLAIWAVYLVIAVAERLGRGRRVVLISASVLAFLLLVVTTIIIRLWVPSFHEFS